jgi:CubicO group peptidase (beta-lactamase class C family)
MFVSESITPAFANNQNKTSYHPYIFADNNRLTKIQTVFPVIDKMYKEYAEKNHFPGYAFGIMVDGQLVYSGSGGYINIKKKIPATDIKVSFTLTPQNPALIQTCQIEEVLKEK